MLTALFSCITVNAYDFVSDGLYYTKLSDGFSVEVSNKSNNTYAKSTYSGDIIIPESVIHENLSYNVTSIGQFAFYNSEVTSVTLPNTIVSIGNYSFAKSSSMKSCVLPPSVDTIGKAAFSECISLEQINIPRGVSILNLETFYRCKSLKEITIPNTVMRIAYASTTWASSGSGALNAFSGFPCFANCTALETVTFEDGDRPISFIDNTPGFTTPTGALFANEIFYGCPIKTIYLGRTLDDSPQKGLFQDFASLTDVIIGPCVKGIQNNAFKNCQGLRTINIPSNVTQLGNSICQNCTNLSLAFIGNGIEILPNRIFADCKNLEELYVGNSIKSVESYVFNNCINLKTVVLCSSIIETLNTSNIPSNIKFYVPSTNLYEILLKDFTIENIGTINNGEYEYTGTTPELSIKSLINTIELSVSNNLSIINAGNYDEEISIDISYPNNWISSFNLNASFNISKAKLTVIANDATKKYGEENPEFTCSFFGFKNNETKDVLTKQPTIETTATITSSVGTYPIIPYGAEARNYSFTYERGKLNVTKADQEIVWDQDFSDVHVGDIVELTAESSSGLPIKYSSTDETIAEVFTQSGKKFVEFLKAGDVSIRANQEGNENYNEADRVSKSIEVKAKSILVSSLTFDYTEWNGNDNSKFQITATVLPENATNKSLEWYSSDEEIATVDQNGLVTILMPGNCIISAKTLDGSNLTATCSVRSLSGTNTIELDTNAKFDIYNINGIMIYESASSEVLNSLSSGFYIIIQNGNAHKIMIQ